MDNEKIVKLNIEKKESLPSNKKKVEAPFHTNPILQEMLKCNSLSEKMKFKFKDLFR